MSDKFTKTTVLKGYTFGDADYGHWSFFGQSSPVFWMPTLFDLVPDDLPQVALERPGEKRVGGTWVITISFVPDEQKP